MDKEKEIVLRSVLRDKGIQKVVLCELRGTNFNPNFYYLGRFDGVGVHMTDIRSGKSTLTVPEMEYERARNCAKNVTRWRKKGIEEIRHAIGNAKRVGLDYNTLSVKEYIAIRKNARAASFRDISREIGHLRSQKTEEEIRLVKKSCTIASEILERCIQEFSTFKTELDVVKYLEQETREMECVFSFPPIVATGKSSAIPHYVPRGKKISPGFCVLDFGVRYKEYCSDISRTIFVGKPSKKEQETYRVVREAQEELIGESRDGVKCSTLLGQAHEKLGTYSKLFIHGLGHGIGLEVHEHPRIGRGSEHVLRENMTFTIEPGIYFKSGGIRIEDDILLSRKGPVLLTSVNKELISVTI